MRYGPGGEFNTALSEGSQNCFLQGHGANVALIIVGRGPPPFRKIAKLLYELGPRRLAGRGGEALVACEQRRVERFRESGVQHQP
jgi:hypothetical protein